MLGKRKVPARAYVAQFNFKGPDQEKKVGKLSGGERNRVHLAKLLKSGGNLLLLDEPTNDLDVDMLRALEEALVDFGGCAVVISHDRWFLDRIATHILAFEGDSQVVWCDGNYQTYEAQRHERLGHRRRPAAPDQVQVADALIPFGPDADARIAGKVRRNARKPKLLEVTPILTHHDTTGAAAIAAVMLLTILWRVRRIDRRIAAQRAGGLSRSHLWLNFALLLLSAAFLAATIRQGVHQDYHLYRAMWAAVREGRDPWWMVDGVFGHYPINAYGPLFNALAILDRINPLLPKLCFAWTYLLFAVGTIKAAVSDGRLELHLDGRAACLVLEPLRLGRAARLRPFRRAGRVCYASGPWRHGLIDATHARARALRSGSCSSTCRSCSCRS